MIPISEPPYSSCNFACWDFKTKKKRKKQKPIKLLKFNSDLLTLEKKKNLKKEFSFHPHLYKNSLVQYPVWENKQVALKGE